MTDQNKSHNYTLADIEQYLKGKLSPAEMHDLEKAALQDPFLADAIEGYKDADLSTAHEHLEEIHLELSLGDAAKYTGIVKPIEPVRWWKIAAAIVLMAGATTIGWLSLNRPESKKDLAGEAVKVAIDTAMKKVNHDSSLLALAKKPLANKPEMADIPKNIKLSGKSVDILGLALPPSFPPVTKVAEMPSDLAPARDKTNDNFEALAMFKKTARAEVIKSQSLSGRSSDVGLRKESSELKDSFKLKPTVIPTRISSDTIYFYSGKLITPENLPVGGASLVLTNNKQKAFVTKPDGSFALGVLDTVLELTVSSVGFEPVKVKLLPGENNAITLQPLRELLSEIVVTGLSSRTKSKVAWPTNPMENDPYPEGGWEAFKKYLLQKLPPAATNPKDKLHGEVHMQLTTNEAGRPVTVSILSSFNDSLNNTIIKAVKEGPGWITPGKKNIQNARVSIQL